MSAQFRAWFAVVGPASGNHSIFRLAIRGTAVALAIGASGCTPTTARVAGADPADPAAKVAGVGYRSTIAPYIALRPSTPASWRERNDSVAPQPKPRRDQP